MHRNYEIEINEILLEHNVKPEHGLNTQQVIEQRKLFGVNELKQKKKQNIFVIILNELKDLMIIILLLAALLSFIMGILDFNNQDNITHSELYEGIVILFIVFLTVAIAVFQQVKTNSALEALKKISAPTSRVIRDGVTIVIPSSELVVGDIVYIEDGVIVPADIRLIEANNLSLQEASLTGESKSVKKHTQTIFGDNIPLGDQKNMCFSSSIVTYGSGVGVVIAVGMNTEVGKIANMINSQETNLTPLKKNLNKIGKILTYIGAIICLLIVVISCFFISGKDGGWNKTQNWLEPLMTSIALAVAAIPEGLPAVATIVMMFGVQKMAKKNALIHKLSVVEVLGSTTVVCSDKTGTLTLNKMTVTNILNLDDILNENFAIIADKKERKEKYLEIINCGILCNNAEIDLSDFEKVIGDPTEGALLTLANSFDINYHDKRKEFIRLSECSFDSIRKRMSVLCKKDEQETIFVKGACEELLSCCNSVLINGKVIELTEEYRKKIINATEQMSKQALRCLGFAEKKWDKSNEIKNIETFEKELTFIGLVGMIDPPRSEVISAINVCHTAGIKVVMITGDHKLTAQVIAKELGIYKDGVNNIIVGNELDAMSDEQLANIIESTTVFARISPEAKLRIVNAFKKNNEIVSMTGDGVNDAPALKTADIGIAMGITGTDVAKNTADMILLDDSFSTIEFAIYEGRKIFRNIQKVIQFLLTGNIAEVLLVFFVFILSAIFPNTFHEALNPIQLLIINIITDTIPCLALGVDSAEKNIMFSKAIKNKNIINKEIFLRILIQGLFFSIISLIAYLLADFIFCAGNNGIGGHGNGWISGLDENNGMTLAFFVIAISQTFHVLNQRSNTESIFSRKNEQNYLLFLTVLISISVVVVLTLISGYGNDTTKKILGINFMSWQCFIIAFLISISILPFVEICKFIKRRTNRFAFL